MSVGVLESALYRQAMRRKVPLAVQLNVTNRCNLTCTHCYRVIEDRDELTTAQWRDLIDQLAAAGTLQLTFSGGEPLLRRDFLEVARHARHRRMALRLYTAATLVTPELADQLADVGFLQVHVSVYSDRPEVHDLVAEVPGAFDRTMRGVRLLRERGLAVRLKCVVMAPNLDSFAGVARLAEELGCTYLFDPVVNAKLDGDRSPTRWRLTPEQLRTYYRHPLVAGTLAPLPAEACDEGFEGMTCGASHASCSVTPYGDVTPCIAVPMPCGNVLDQPFAEIWANSPQMLAMRAIRTTDLAGCGGCRVKAACFRCPGKALTEDGGLLEPSSSACQDAAAQYAVRRELFPEEVAHA